jgi:hypothetical protein
MKVEQKVVYEEIWFQVEYSWENSDDFAGLYFIATKILELAGSSEEEMKENKLEKEPMLVGHIKWDGCMNVQMQSDYVHFCGRYMSKQYGELFNKLYDKAKEVGCNDN